ncbi:MAG: hypothetical protein K2W96_00010 [Gemmataceae bacterium]|nr:hypothetical protein [Gemmataceae bacterium]
MSLFVAPSVTYTPQPVFARAARPVLSRPISLFTTEFRSARVPTSSTPRALPETTVV